MTLADYVEQWGRERGLVIPSRDTPEWVDLFLAFAGRNLLSAKPLEDR